MSTLDQKYEYEQQPGRILPMLTGLVIGSLVGAVTALLFAPQPGEKTRAEVQQGAIHLRDQTSETVKDKVAQVKSKANQIKADVQIKVGDLQHQGQDLIVRQLDRVAHAAEVGKKAILESQDHKVI